MGSNATQAETSVAQPAVLDPRRPLAAPFRMAVGRALTTFLDAQQSVLGACGPEMAPLRSMATELLSGGKRLRPAFAVWGYVAAGGVPGEEFEGLLTAAASLELLHVSALVHDDVMDGSALRRGRPAAHKQFSALHETSAWRGNPDAFGRAAAILLGDLLLMWSVEMVQRSRMEPAALLRALPILEATRTEVTCGQYLDVVAQARPWPSGSALDSASAEADRVVEFKSARYTVQRPCQLGAALAGGDERLHRSLAAYGSPLGRAFQFRDDLLGVFGDSLLTGKPVGDDLREGKRTVLVAHAYAHADAAGRQLLVRRLGDPALDGEGVAALQQVIVDSGAAAACEARIAEGFEQALAALAGADVTDEGRTALVALAEAAVQRVS